MKRFYTSKQQSKIIEMYLSGNTVTELSNRYGIARSTIYSWLNDSKNSKLLNRKINMRDVIDLKQKCELESDHFVTAKLLSFYRSDAIS